jgi:hypothetical protein
MVCGYEFLHCGIRIDHSLPDVSSTTSHRSNLPVIIGASVGGGAFLIIILLAIIFYLYKRRQKHLRLHSDPMEQRAQDKVDLFYSLRASQLESGTPIPPNTIVSQNKPTTGAPLTNQISRPYPLQPLIPVQPQEREKASILRSASQPLRPRASIIPEARIRSSSQPHVASSYSNSHSHSHSHPQMAHVQHPRGEISRIELRGSNVNVSIPRTEVGGLSRLDEVDSPKQQSPVYAP